MRYFNIAGPCNSTENGKYYALYCSLESMQQIIEPEKGIPEIVKTIRNTLRFSGFPHSTEFAKEADYANYTAYQMPRYLKDGRIDMDYLMRDFQQFWRENSDIWIERFDYKEAAPHLVMMAFLQRVINGGGQIIREMAAGKGRLDLCLIYENRKYPIELKIRYGEKYLAKGVKKTAEYMDIYTKKESVDGKTITVIGV
jgi:hypothetical protein